MNLTKFDITIIVVMSIAVISMSFVFPALGLSDSSTNESDVPEFDMSSDRFDFAGEMPDNPGTPSQGNLEVMSNEGSEITLHDNSSYTVRMTAINEPGSENLTPQVNLFLYDVEGGEPQGQANVTLDNIGDSDTIDDLGYEIDVQWTSTLNVNQSDETAVVRYEITDQLSGEGWLTRVPIIGGIIDAGEALAQIVAWIGSIIWWGLTFVVEMSLNVIGMIFDVAVYFASTMSWLINTYTSIISSANAWAAVFVAIPGILLFGEFSKIVIVLISILPTT